MPDGDPAFERINSFALVGYIPGHLGDFISELRAQLVSGCLAQSHVSILPPRPLFIDTAVAEAEICSRVASFSPLELEFTEIRLFEQTSVIYADLGTGREDLIQIHDALNDGAIEFDEPFLPSPHHPGARIAPEHLFSLYELTVRKWKEGLPDRSFPVRNLTFVQNTVTNVWIDLADCKLAGAMGYQVLETI
ncbi:MAG: 2'-5' RNA ligase family protein [Bryobacteraceae bacterium]